MDYLKIVEQLGKGFPYGLIDGSCAQRAADYHEDRFVGSEMTQFQCGKLISPGKLLPDRRTGKYRFFRREGTQGLGEITAYLGTNRDTQLIGKTGRHVGFVDNTGDFQRRSSEHDEEQIEIKKLADVLSSLDFSGISDCPYKNLSEYFKDGRTSINSEAISTGGYGSYGSFAKVIEEKLKEQGINTAGRSWRMYKKGDTYNLFLTDSMKITPEMNGLVISCTQYDIKNNKVIHGTMNVTIENQGQGTYPVLNGESFVPDKE